MDTHELKCGDHIIAVVELQVTTQPVIPGDWLHVVDANQDHFKIHRNSVLRDATFAEMQKNLPAEELIRSELTD